MSTSTLPALVANSQEISRQLLETQGELTPELETALAISEVELPAKIEGYVFTLEELEMREAYFKQKADYFSQIASTFANAQSFMKERLKIAAKDLGVNELVGIDHKFTFQNSKPSVIIEDESKIDQIYLREKIMKSIDKTKIGEDLKLGVPVPGAYLQENKTMKIAANRKALK